MTGREAMLVAFDRLYDKAAAKLSIECSPDERDAARRAFANRFRSALDAAAEVVLPEIPDEVMRSMEEAIDNLPAAQVVGYLAAIPLMHRAQEMARVVFYRAARQRALDHLITQASDRYGGN